MRSPCAECGLRNRGGVEIKATKAPTIRGIAKIAWCWDCVHRIRRTVTQIGSDLLPIIDATGRVGGDYEPSTTVTEAIAALFVRKPTAIRWVSR